MCLTDLFSFSVLQGGDFIFDALQLWQDRNHDGVSQADELRSLPDAGVVSLNVVATQRLTELDANGNDVGTQGSFVRSDGREGLIVDVYFRTGDRGLVR